MADILQKAIDHADNFRPEHDKSIWQFRVFDVPYPVGLIRDVFMTATFPDGFKIDKANRIVTLDPALKGRTQVQSADQAFIEFCEKNTALCPGFAPWLKKPANQRDWHAIFGLDGPLRSLRISTPCRGVFGVATAGIHCNAYQTDGNGAIDTIWMSKRSATATFSGSFDNFIGGAMDVQDDMQSLTAFKREAGEEVGMILAPDGKTMLYKGAKCGELRNGVQVLSIATLKGPIAGKKEEGHLEFALRYSFDLHLVPGFKPTPHDEDVGQFYPVKVKDIATIFNRPWKYSSGAVMVDWILRNDLMAVSPAQKQAMLARLRYQIPLKNVQKYLK